MRTISALVITFLYSTMAIGQTEVPNTFQAGQPARAAEVNANFSTLETAVNTNATAISTVAAITIPRVKANGQDIGAFLTSSHDDDPKNLFRRRFWALSDTGYVFSIYASNTSSGPAGELLRRLLWFETPDCSGPAYVAATLAPDFPLSAHFVSGAVFVSLDENDNPGVYYTPKGSAPNTVVLQSQTSTSGGVTICNAKTEAVDAFLVIPNDPFITGVPSQRVFAPPITLGVQTIQVSPP